MSQPGGRGSFRTEGAIAPGSVGAFPSPGTGWETASSHSRGAQIESRAQAYQNRRDSHSTAAAPAISATPDARRVRPLEWVLNWLFVPAELPIATESTRLGRSASDRPSRPGVVRWCPKAASCVSHGRAAFVATFLPSRKGDETPQGSATRWRHEDGVGMTTEGCGCVPPNN